jgi:signal transduction histidine kinase
LAVYDVSSERDAELYAGAIFSHRESILDAWCDLIDIDSTEPASDFIRNQLDSTILALANWFLGIDPEDSSMSHQWTDIRPSSEMTVGAVVSMSVLPEAVRQSIPENSDFDLVSLISLVSSFSGMMTYRLLVTMNLDFDEERWAQIAQDVEARYEAQRALRIRRLGVLIEIAHAVSTSRDLDTLFEHVQRSVIQLSGSDYIEISLLDQASQKLRCYLVYGDGKRQTALEQTLIEEGLAKEVLATGESLLVSDYVTACRDLGIPPSSALIPAPQRAWIGAPMCLGDETIGVIAVSGTLTSYDSEDMELLSAIARQTAVALDNRRLIEAQQRHVAQLSALNQFARETAHLRDAATLMQIAASRIHEFFDFGLVTVFRTSRDGDSLIMKARSPLSIDEEPRARQIRIGSGSVVAQVAQTMAAALYNDVRELDSYFSTESTRSTRSEMAVPIVLGDRLLGVLDVQSNHVNAFDQHDLTALHTIADQLSVGLENSRLFAEEAQRTRELQLMLDTTRAASSSLMLDEVLESLAEGLASVAGTDHCLIHLYDPDERCFTPAMSLNADATASLFHEWNHRLAVDQHLELQQVLDDAFPQLICSRNARRNDYRTRRSTFLVPLRTRQRTLGLAIVAAADETDLYYPIEQMRLLQGVADSAALAVENARLYARAHGLAISEERGRIAQEIHDTLAQGLTAISLQLDLADSYLPSQPEQATRNVQRALDLTRENLNEARRSVLDLRAADVHHMSLPDAISRLLRRLGDESTINFEFVFDGLTSRLSARVEVGLYRILEEALENARRHSRATRVRTEIHADGRTVTVEVTDNGAGFEPDHLSRDRENDQGFGLLGIRERARLLGGSLMISSKPGAGTALRVTVPHEARLQAAVSPQHGGQT